MEKFEVVFKVVRQLFFSGRDWSPCLPDCFVFIDFGFFCLQSINCTIVPKAAIAAKTIA